MRKHQLIEVHDVNFSCIEEKSSSSVADGKYKKCISWKEYGIAPQKSQRKHHSGGHSKHKKSIKKGCVSNNRTVVCGLKSHMNVQGGDPNNHLGKSINAGCVSSNSTVVGDF